MTNNSAAYWNEKYQRQEDEGDLWTWNREHTWKELSSCILDQYQDGPYTFSLLDLGCGIGAFTNWLAHNLPIPNYRSFIGIDRSPWAINYALQHKGEYEEYLVGEVEDTKFPDNYFDFVVANELIEHVANVDQLLIEVGRILRSNGYLIITTPHNGCLGDVGEHYHTFTHDSLFHLLIGYAEQVIFYPNTNWFEADSNLDSIVAVARIG